MTALAEKDITRLIKLLGMLGSASVGERAAAALKVTEFVRDHQAEWDDLLRPQQAVVSVSVGPVPHPTPSWGQWAPPPPPPPPLRTWRNAVHEASLLILPAKDRDFVAGLGRRRTLSPAQEQWLRDICSRSGVPQW